MELSENGIVCNEFNENAKYKSFAWHTPTYDEMKYIVEQRPNASNLKGLGRVNIDGIFVNGCFLLPDDFIAPEGVSFVPTFVGFTTNSYSLYEFTELDNLGVVFLPYVGFRDGVNLNNVVSCYWVSPIRRFFFTAGGNGIDLPSISRGQGVRFVRNSLQGKFSTPTGNIDFAPANLQYHCTKHIWRFAENQYDYIGQANDNISDSYDGWIDLFGYGTSGVNFSPTLHSTNNADYASGSISGTANDWGVNIINENSYFDKNIKIYNNSTIVANNIDENI